MSEDSSRFDGIRDSEDYWPDSDIFASTPPQQSFVFDQEPIFDDYDLGGGRFASSPPPVDRVPTPEPLLPEWAVLDKAKVTGVRIGYWGTVLNPFYAAYGAPFAGVRVPRILESMQIINVNAADLFGTAAAQLARESPRQIETYLMERLIDFLNTVRNDWTNDDKALAFAVTGVFDAVVLLNRSGVNNPFTPLLLTLEALGDDRKVFQSSAFAVAQNSKSTYHLRSIPSAPGADDRGWGPAGHVVGIFYRSLVDREAPVQVDATLEIKARIEALDRISRDDFESSTLIGLFFEMTLANPAAPAFIVRVLRATARARDARGNAEQIKNYFSTRAAPAIASDPDTNVLDWPATTIYAVLVRTFLTLHVDTANLDESGRQQLNDAFVITGAALAGYRSKQSTAQMIPKPPPAPEKGAVVDI